MEIGDRVLVCHRPARIAFEARMDREASAGARQEIHEKIMEVLSLDVLRKSEEIEKLAKQVKDLVRG